MIYLSFIKIVNHCSSFFCLNSKGTQKMTLINSSKFENYLYKYIDTRKYRLINKFAQITGFLLSLIKIDVRTL